MGVCNIDHSLEDVQKKLKGQESFLPDDLARKVHQFLENEQSQENLNELFHLLKKYDLASKLEREERDKKLAVLIS
ncbi:hypothetical protein [Virgibacillus alimentarius]|uniref:Tartrate dehydratase alpha subunit/fumarate hydratase class I-like protein n=1 Tax=Virgibacillus alimentarius TaxID=698769 RepID=A0ABS4SA35_9BACI|nr:MULTISPECIES: hypothetical protein [Virgibacillus]MBP2258370.1 tartrate dehydratase alpha subunit/fumarate hydratase class I-like protein [Virgibacillus alimentarius]HLR67934.1 hypothetical protein [Virgibacillus sp.]